MRANALLFALASTISACSASGPGTVPDAATDAPTTDTPAATDTPVTVDVPAATDTPAVADSGSPVDAPADAGSPLPPRDAGPLPLDGGSLGEPAWVALDVRTSSSCPPLAPCGGDEAGTWDVGGGCIDVPIPSQLMACPGARVTRASGRARGRVTFAAGFARRASQWEVETELFVPQLCAAFVGGCPGLQAAIRASYPDSVCVAEGAGDCRCTARQAGSIDDADRYAISGGQIVSATSGKRWNYCVAGADLRYQDVSGSGPREPGIIRLTRRAP